MIEPDDLMMIAASLSRRSPPDLRDDLCQEAALAMFRVLTDGRLDLGRSLPEQRSFLRRAGRSRILDYLKARSRRVSREVPLEALDPPQDLGERVSFEGLTEGLTEIELDYLRMELGEAGPSTRLLALSENGRKSVGFRMRNQIRINLARLGHGF